jgi:polysaccharide biosynthesis/export protein
MTCMKTRSILTGMLLICLNAASFSQMLDNRSEQKTGSAASAMQDLLKGQSPMRASVLDGPVDAKAYIVGPGDVFSVSVWSSVPLALTATVTPEGTVIIPTVGEFYVAGKTLEETKQTVIGEIRKRYSQQQVTFTLTVPRSFSVIVKGNVLSEGKYIVQATDRADVAIAMANALPPSGKEGSKDDQMQKERERIIDDVSQRHIEVVHKDGTKAAVDLECFYAYQNSAFNQYLRDGDLIIVPKKDVLKNYFSIYGAVNKEGVYEFSEGDRLLTAIMIARGVTPLVDSSRVTVIRSNANGNKSGEFYSSLDDIQRDGGMLMQRGDQIIVTEKLELRRNNRVYVEGEVNSPGYYPITKDSTLLSAIIHQANGFTASASLKTSRLYRRTVNEKDIQDERLESARGGYTPDDSAYYFLETNIRINREQVPIDFEALFLRNMTSEDVFLKNGDVVSIGTRVKTIYIFGQVVKPGHYTYTPGKTVDSYITEAGGYTSESRESDLRIIKANTRQWLKPSETSVEEGDYIWVPKVPYHPSGYYLQLTSQVFGILGAVGTLVLMVYQITK